jgi:hypothetical protein
LPGKNLRQKLARTGEKRASKSTFTRRQSNYLTCLRAIEDKKKDFEKSVKGQVFNQKWKQKKWDLKEC